MIRRTIYAFFQRQLNPAKALLLALSGGPDSRALLHLLIEYRKKVPFELHIAHIDHGWRSESQEEAKSLENLLRSLDCPFHLKVLKKEELKGNLEEACRDKRLEFFKELCQKYSFQGVVLGHHANDQAETILKKIFENSHLAQLSAMQEISLWEGVPLWRPLLSFQKKEILSFLEENAHSFFVDRTNLDTKFLRGRMRVHIFPYLEENFGKNVVPSLLRLGEEAEKMHAYLEKRVEEFWCTRLEGTFGLRLDFSSLSEEVEIKHLIRKMAKSSQITVSLAIVEALYQQIMASKANKKIICKECVWLIDRKVLFLTSTLYI